METEIEPPPSSVAIARTPSEAQSSIMNALKRSVPPALTVRSLQSKSVAEHDVYAIYVEATGLDRERLSAWVDENVQIAYVAIYHPSANFGNNGKKVLVIDNTHDTSTLLALRPFFSNASIRKVYHNYGLTKALLGRYFLTDGYRQQVWRDIWQEV